MSRGLAVAGIVHACHLYVPLVHLHKVNTTACRHYKVTAQQIIALTVAKTYISLLQIQVPSINLMQ